MAAVFDAAAQRVDLHVFPGLGVLGAHAGEVAFHDGGERVCRIGSPNPRTPWISCGVITSSCGITAP